MVSVCLSSDALLQHLPSYLAFSYLGHGVSLHSCSSKAQPLLLTLDKGYLLTATLPDLQRGIAPLGPPAPTQPLLLRIVIKSNSPDCEDCFLNSRMSLNSRSEEILHSYRPETTQGKHDCFLFILTHFLCKRQVPFITS